MELKCDTVTLTALEQEVIDNIRGSDWWPECGNEDDPVWAFCATEGGNEKQLRGALSSLIKKGIVGFQGESRKGEDDEVVWLIAKEVAV